MAERRREEATAELWRAIEERRDELVGIVADLVRRPSVLGHEAEVQAYVADHLRGSGMATPVATAADP
jgi:acetylornithine deacetylase/succinyl-diaminopimelate desuccinylase-like protein